MYFIQNIYYEYFFCSAYIQSTIHLFVIGPDKEHIFILLGNIMPYTHDTFVNACLFYCEETGNINE